MSLRQRNTTVTYKTETTPGVDSAPTVAANLVSRATAANVGSEPQITDDNELRGGLGAGEPIIGGVPMKPVITCNVSGSPTAGTPPEWADLIESCGFLESLSATPVPSSGTGVATAGTATTLTMSAAANPTFSATNGFYVGQWAELSVNPTVTQVTAITGYTISGGNITITFADTFSPVLSATTAIKILPNALYRPHSGVIPSGSLYVYRDATAAIAGVLWKVLGNQGAWDMTWTAAGKGSFNFGLTGVFGGKSDVVLPSTPVASVAQPPIWLNGRMTINRQAVGLRQLTLNSGNTGVLPPDPNAVEGFGPYEITARNMQGQCDPIMTLVATRDLFADLRGQTLRVIAALLGPKSAGTAGSRVGLFIPQAKFREVAETDDQGLLRDSVRFQAVGVNDEAYLCVF
jgi:hypothetical protein